MRYKSTLMKTNKESKEPKEVKTPKKTQESTNVQALDFIKMDPVGPSTTESIQMVDTFWDIPAPENEILKREAQREQQKTQDYMLQVNNVPYAPYNDEYTPYAADTGTEDYQSIAQVESNGSYTAQNPTSTAYGKYQFLEGTYKQAQAELGMNYYDIRTPQGQETAMKWLTEKNQGYLRNKNIPVNPVTTYLAHQQGAAGANRIYNNNMTERDIELVVANTPEKDRTGNPREDWFNTYTKKLL